MRASFILDCDNNRVKAILLVIAQLDADTVCIKILTATLKLHLATFEFLDLAEMAIEVNGLGCDITDALIHVISALSSRQNRLRLLLWQCINDWNQQLA